MKIPVERKVSVYNVKKKKKKMVRLNYYVLKNGHSENYLLLWLMTPLLQKKKGRGHRLMIPILKFRV